MHIKKNMLMVSLVVLTAVLAFSLGNIDFFGLLENNQSLNVSLLLTAVITTYLIAITIFMLDFSDRHHLIRLYSFNALLFGTTVYFLHKNIAAAVIITVFFLCLIVYTYTKSLSRSKLFINFRPNDIFQPVVKNAFLWLVIIFASLSFIQTEKLAQQNNFVPKLLTILNNQLAPIINNQLTSQLTNQLNNLPPLSNDEKVLMIRQALTQTVYSFPREQTINWLGIEPEKIPIEKVNISPTGAVDIKPVFSAMVNQISQHLNKKFGSILGFAPIAVAILTIVLLQSLLWPLHLIAGLFTPILFYVLTTTGFIKKASEFVEVERMVL